FTMVEHDMGEQELVAAERAPGEYVADGSPASMFGTWRLQAIVRIAGREDVSTIFTFPVGAAVAGTGSNSQVLTIGTYTAIVFTDTWLADILELGVPLVLFAGLWWWSTRKEKKKAKAAQADRAAAVVKPEPQK